MRLPRIAVFDPFLGDAGCVRFISSMTETGDSPARISERWDSEVDDCFITFSAVDRRTRFLRTI